MLARLTVGPVLTGISPCQWCLPNDFPAGEAEVTPRDIADVKRLKQQDGPNLVTHGSTELVHALLAHDLVDAMSIFTLPVVLGSGKKLFAEVQSIDPNGGSVASNP